MKAKTWIIGLSVAILATAPAIAFAQSTGEKTEKKMEKATDKAESKMEKAKDKAESTTEKAKASTKDTWLTSKTKIALFADDRVSGTNVHVETRDGVVMLRGKVASADEKKAAADIAKSVEGVKDVKNDLQVVAPANRKAVEAKDADIQKAVKSRFSKDTRLKGIDVRADNGVVTLSGDVKDLNARARASELARGVAGVKSVKNELKEKS